MIIKVKDAGKVRILELKGELKLGGAVMSVEETVKGLLASGHSQIVVNLADVSWLDTSGIACLVASRKRCIDKGGDVKLLMPSETVGRILRAFALHLWFKVFDTELKAVGSF
jgi:anti-anti-sigma factor